MSGIKAGKVVKYVALPGVFPRLRGFFASGFGRVAFFMAQIYAMVRLLPAEHPYLDAANIGKFGLRHVIAAAADNLVFSRKNIDQIIVFGLLLLGIAILALQIVLLIVTAVFGLSFVEAAPMASTYAVASSMFVTNNPNDDIAFMLLDRVFGLPKFFKSCVSEGLTCAGAASVSGPFPWPFHLALHQLFRFYSTGILIIGVLVFAYYIVVIIAETATSGTPFGQRFQNVWVPIRLVLAIGLLVPLPISYPGGGSASAYSSGQYIVFAAAKYGSGFATNAWIKYNNAVYEHALFSGGDKANPLGEKETLIAFPKQVDAAPIVEAMATVHLCAFSHYFLDKKITKNSSGAITASNIPFPDELADLDGYRTNMPVKAFFLKTPADWMTTNNSAGMEMTDATTYQDALDFFHGGEIVVSFGYLKDPAEDPSPDNVVRFCGEVSVNVTDPRDSDGSTGIYPAASDPYYGAVAVQKTYFNVIRNLWASNDLAENYVDFAGRYTLLNINSDKDLLSPCEMGCAPSANAGLPLCTVPAGGGDKSCHRDEISGTWKQMAINTLQDHLDEKFAEIWASYSENNTELSMDTGILDRGWGGAGIWFNRIASVSGSWTSALGNPPRLSLYPEVMNKVRAIRVDNSKNVSLDEAFNPSGAADDTKAIEASLETVHKEAYRMATLFYKGYKYFRGDQLNFKEEDKVVTGALETAMNSIFGTYGLFAMASENAQTHPLAQLTTLGRGLVEASIRNVAISSGASAMGGIAAATSKSAGVFVDAVSGFFNSVAFIGLTAGLVLYYIVPFLPFLYFFFAVASWVKTIFEAMVGVPLWALAHLRLDGDGLSGDSAQNGYFLILEIFLRPILTVFGLLAAMAIFTAQVRILNVTWQLVTENAGGFNADTQITAAAGNIELKRSIVDQFFFTITYAIVVYMMAVAAFKLVDTIPDNILRWIGSGASSFGDINQDQTGELTRYAALGGMTVGREAATGIKELGQGIGGIGGRMAAASANAAKGQGKGP